MPKYSCELKKLGYESPPIYPCDVLDGNGDLIDLEIVAVDTETGKVIHREMEEGVPKVVDDHFNDLITWFKYPLSVIPYDHENRKHLQVAERFSYNATTLPKSEWLSLPDVIIVNKDGVVKEINYPKEEKK